MKHKNDFILVILISLLTMSCHNNNPNILVDVQEVDFLNKTDDVMEGKLVKSEIFGATNIVVYKTYKRESLGNRGFFFWALCQVLGYDCSQSCSITGFRAVFMLWF